MMKAVNFWHHASRAQPLGKQRETEERPPSSGEPRTTPPHPRPFSPTVGRRETMRLGYTTLQELMTPTMTTVHRSSARSE